MNNPDIPRNTGEPDIDKASQFIRKLDIMDRPAGSQLLESVSSEFF